MTANDDTPSTGKEPAESIDDELQTDGGVSRRVFLGAAAALSTLTAATGTAAADGGNEAEEYVSPKDSDTDYGYSSVVDTSGGLDLHVGMDRNYETSVTVSSHPEGIGLRLSNEIGSMSVLLLPEDIEPLCQELLDAREKTSPHEVEYSREWITEEFRDGGSDADE